MHSHKSENSRYKYIKHPFHYINIEHLYELYSNKIILLNTGSVKKG